MQAESDVLIRVEGHAGRITLTRPLALNAVNQTIVTAMIGALLDWAGNADVKMVLVDGEGEKAFCAGGDLTTLYQAGKAGDFGSARQFWRQEYQLNALIARYPKPYIVIMHGFVLGGGVGLSGHGSHRIVTENSVVAMPECGIGLIPDVGGTHLLAKAPGRLGEYLALTGRRMGPADAIHCRFADFYVPRIKLADMKTALISEGHTGALDEFTSVPPPSSLAGDQSEIDIVFDAASVQEIVARLERSDRPWATEALAAIAKGSPVSVLATFEAIGRARAAATLSAALRNEYRFVSRSMQLGDFLEGIRAQVIDKDRKPNWRHAALDMVPPALVEEMLSEADDGDFEIDLQLEEKYRCVSAL